MSVLPVLHFFHPNVHITTALVNFNKLSLVQSKQIEGRRRRARQRMRWLDGITDSMDMSLAGSGSWWWTGRPGLLQSMGRKWSDATERPNWTELCDQSELISDCRKIPFKSGLSHTSSITLEYHLLREECHLPGIHNSPETLAFLLHSTQSWT